MTLELPTAEDTKAFGARIAEVLKAGDLIVLAGAIGAGKTTLAQGIGAGLGVTSPIMSPTFVLSRIHPEGRIPMVHVDAYRLGSVAEVDDLDLDASTDDSVTIVEWGQGLVEQLTDDHLVIALERHPDDRRTATITAHGDSWHGRLPGH